MKIVRPILFDIDLTSATIVIVISLPTIMIRKDVGIVLREKYCTCKLHSQRKNVYR